MTLPPRIVILPLHRRSPIMTEDCGDFRVVGATMNEVAQLLFNRCMMECVAKERRLPMSIEISQETKPRLTSETRRLGVTVDALLARFIIEYATLPKPRQPAAPCRSGISAAPENFTGETSTTTSVEPGIVARKPGEAHPLAIARQYGLGVAQPILHTTH